MPILWALANPKLDEREVLSAMLDREPHPATDRPSLLVIADKGFASKEFEADLAFRGAELLRPSFKREKKRRGQSLLKSVRQLIESVNDTLKGQLDLEQHGGRTFEGVAVRVAQRILAMAAAIWHNHKTGRPLIRSLIAERCRSFHAVITGSIRAHCSSDKSLGYGVRSLTPPPQQSTGCGPADCARTHTTRRRQNHSKSYEPPSDSNAGFLVRSYSDPGHWGSPRPMRPVDGIPPMISALSRCKLP